MGENVIAVPLVMAHWLTADLMGFSHEQSQDFIQYGAKKKKKNTSKELQCYRQVRGEWADCFELTGNSNNHSIQLWGASPNAFPTLRLMGYNTTAENQNGKASPCLFLILDEPVPTLIIARGEYGVVFCCL